MAAAGCGDDPASPGADSRMSFSYSGAGAASATTFSAAGQVPANVQTTFGTTEFAAGATDPTSSYTVVLGAVPRSSTTIDFAAVSATRTTAGTTPIDASCSDPEATDCTGVIVLYNFNGNGDTFSYECFLTTGSVTITSITAQKIAGTFSGTGTCYNSNFLESPYSISNGTFNVDVSSQIFAGATTRLSRSSLLRGRSR